MPDNNPMYSCTLNTAVLLLVFNRLDTTKQVFEAIRQAKPPRLYVAADGARASCEGEMERVAAVRDYVMGHIDWDCEVKTLFRDENVGCKYAVSGAIDWFFNNEEEGIILEDDVLPLPTFFFYCEELLKKYRDNQSISMISGCNFISNQYIPDSSYFFSKYSHIWGWATWRRSWVTYDVSMAEWPSWRDRGGLKKISDGNKAFPLYWSKIMERVYAGKIDTWDYQWVFSCWSRNALSILPRSNLVYNLGFDSLDATHTKGDMPECVIDSAPENISLPLKHPESVEQSLDADILIDRLVFSITWFGAIKSKVPGVLYVERLLRKIKRIYAA